jgi:hypothetical protein
LVTESPPTSINLERAAHKKLHTLSYSSGQQKITCKIFIYLVHNVE